MATHDLLDQPEALEQLYREAPERFHDQFQVLRLKHPDALLTRAWVARLTYDEAPGTGLSLRDIGLVILLSVLAGTLANLPRFFDGLPEAYYYPRHLGFIVFPSLAALFLLRTPPGRSIVLTVTGLFAGGLLFVNLLPRLDDSDTLLLTWMHLPLALWLTVGLAYTGARYREREPWMNYLRLNGETLVYAAIIGLAGLLLSGITVGLFAAIGISVEDLWFTPYLVGYGAAAIPVVAAYLAIYRSRPGQQLAPLVARLFSPLALLVLAGYLGTMLVQGRSPFTDRDFLIIFNAMLLGVLALTVFTLSERPAAGRQTFSDLVCLVLIFMALIIDLVALAAIGFRLASFGLTPNRLAVLGANLLIFIHLVDLLVGYGRFLRDAAPIEAVEGRVTRFLPVYGGWVVFVAVAFPFLFGFA
ncbi:MAG: hypothetical protein D6685_06775 [Bacteroidetes bacterium]|nr:MAG: hypothetical protein D6685_06775 [Bacteroidota bacterium]